MQVTLEEAAAKLGKSVRQLRYMLKQGRLPGAKMVAGRWFVELSSLPATPGQARAAQRKRTQLRAAVEEALDLPAPAPEKGRAARYSVSDLRSFRIALEAHRTISAALGKEHLAARTLYTSLEHLTQGCHRFESGAKAESFRAARDEASRAVCGLFFEGTPPA